MLIVKSQRDLDRMRGRGMSKIAADLDEIDEYIDRCDENRAEIARKYAAGAARHAVVKEYALSLRKALLKTWGMSTQARRKALADLDGANVGRAVRRQPTEPRGVGGAFLTRLFQDAAQGQIDAYWGARR